MQSRSQSRLYQTKPSAEVEGDTTIAAVHHATSDKVARPQPAASPAISPARTAAPVRSPHKSAVAKLRPKQSMEEGPAADHQVSMCSAAVSVKAAVHESGLLRIMLLMWSYSMIKTGSEDACEKSPHQVNPHDGARSCCRGT